MQRREITLDDEADRGLDEIEEANGSALIRQKGASEASFRLGTAVDWESVKRRNGL